MTLNGHTDTRTRTHTLYKHKELYANCPCCQTIYDRSLDTNSSHTVQTTLFDKARHRAKRSEARCRLVSMKIDPYYQRQICSTMAVVYGTGNVDILGGYEASNDIGVHENVD